MVITFGNQKGGVGKTTLCTLFANYLASIGRKTLVVDCDNQQTITEKRKADIKKYTDAKFLYNVQSFSISNVENVQNLMNNLRKMNGVILIDAPGNLAQQGLIHGTSPRIRRWANPSTMAVFPVPGSPTRMGLFLVFLEMICRILLISESRPIEGSIIPSSASLFRFLAYFFK